MIEKDIKRQVFELTYIADRFLDNSYEPRLAVYLFDELENISHKIKNNHFDEPVLNAFINNLPDLNREELKYVPRSFAEKAINLSLLLFILPFLLARHSLFMNPSGKIKLIDSITETPFYKSKRREKARNQITDSVVIVSNLAIETYNEMCRIQNKN